MSRFDIPDMWLAVCGAAAFLLGRAVPIASFEAPDWTGWLVLAAGWLWAAAAGRLFLGARTPIQPRRTPRILLVEGPYRWNRNPIYTGMTVMLVGWAIVLGAASAFLPAILFPFLMTRRFILDEERALVAAFGPEAEAFLSRTRRW